MNPVDQTVLEGAAAHNVLAADCTAAKLVVMLPALNEAATIADVIEGIPRAIPGIRDVEVLVVDDGSTDQTAGIAREKGAVVVSHRRNMGVGRAFQTGIAKALELGADIIVNIDADGQFNPEDIPRLIEPILSGEGDCTTCTRFKDPAHRPNMPVVKRWGNRVVCWMVNKILWNAGFTDVACGFRAYSREAALRMTLYGSYTYTQEVLIDLVGKGMRFVEVPLAVRGVRQHGESRVARSVVKYALQTLPIILRAARDLRPLAFFGTLGLGLLAVGFSGFAVVGANWLATGRTSPWTSLIPASAVVVTLGALAIMLGLLADQVGRLKRTADELLLWERRRSLARADETREIRRASPRPTEEGTGPCVGWRRSRQGP